jgi:hypothetical protein
MDSDHLIIDANRPFVRPNRPFVDAKRRVISAKRLVVNASHTVIHVNTMSVLAPGRTSGGAGFAGAGSTVETFGRLLF